MFFLRMYQQHFWFSVYIDGVEIVDGTVFLNFRRDFYRAFRVLKAEMQLMRTVTKAFGLTAVPHEGH